MNLKKLTFLWLFMSSFIYSSAQSSTVDYGTFVMYKNAKYIQQFTNDKFEEIKTTIESKRQDHEQVRWDITDYTYVIIKSRDEIATGTVQPTTNTIEEEE